MKNMNTPGYGYAEKIWYTDTRYNVSRIFHNISLRAVYDTNDAKGFRTFPIQLSWSTNVGLGCYHCQSALNATLADRDRCYNTPSELYTCAGTWYQIGTAVSQEFCETLKFIDLFSLLYEKRPWSFPAHKSLNFVGK